MFMLDVCILMLLCCSIQSDMASPYAEGVFLDAEGAFLYAWAVCSELLSNSDGAYFKSKPQTLNPKPYFYEFSRHESLES